MNILALFLLALLILALLSFYFAPSESRFEISRKAEKNRKYAELDNFLGFYPGLFALSRLVATFVGVFFVVIFVETFGAIGGLYAFFMLILIDILARLFRDFAQSIIAQNLKFLIKYLSFARIFNRLDGIGEPPRISSVHELFHILNSADFLDQGQKYALKNALELREKTVKDVLIPRDKIYSVKASAKLTPLFIDELYKSGIKIFPVENKNEFVGLLYLDDLIEIDGEEKVLRDVMRKLPEPVDVSRGLTEVLRDFAKADSSLLFIKKNGEIVGLVTLKDLAQALH